MVGAKTASYFVPAGFLCEFVAVVVMRRWQKRPGVGDLASLWLLFIGALFIIVNMQGDRGCNGVAAVSYASR